MSHLKIAFIPMLHSQKRPLFQAAYQRFMVPLAPLNLASYLEASNLPLEILIHDDVETILNYKPDIIAISSVSENFGHAQHTAKILKTHYNPFIIVGGPHFTSFPYFLPECFDAGGIGEGEEIMKGLIEAYLQSDLNTNSLEKVNGIVFRKNDGKLHFTPPVKGIENLDSLPIPQREKWVKHLGVPHIMTTRGCVYRCFFCAEPVIFKKYRENSAERITNEVECLLKHYPDTKHIRFFDDIFPVNRKRLRQLAELFEKKGINRHISFSCFVHAKLLNEETADLLKKMNFIFVQFGAETGSSQRIQDIKPSSSIDLNQRAIDLLNMKGIKVGLTLIAGTPQETEQDLQQTYQFIYKNRKKVFDVEVSPAVALPGTELFLQAQKKGLIPNFQTIDWDVFRDSAHLIDFDMNKYIYLAENIRPSFFNSMLTDIWALEEEIHQLHGTVDFLKENFLAGYMPVEFKSPSFHENHYKRSYV